MIDLNDMNLDQDFDKQRRTENTWMGLTIQYLDIN